MTFDEILAQVLELLQREGRVSYRALKRRFKLDDEYIEDLKAEIIQAKKLAIDEDGAVLVWTGSAVPPSTPTLVVRQKGKRGKSEKAKGKTSSPDSRPQTLDSPRPEAERRQLTVMFCDPGRFYGSLRAARP